MEKINDIISEIDNYVWGIPLIVLIMVCGLWLTARIGLLQVRKLGLALKYMFKDEEGGNGEVSSFQALCTALSATVGTGNIVGVATAICAGGPGALFWMEVAAFLGMATKYAEGLLAIKYRRTDKNGNMLGGPFYYIENGLGKNWRWLGKLFALFGLLAGLMGIGTITQINGITSAANNFFDPEGRHIINVLGVDQTVTTVVAGLVITLLAALIIIGGIKRIATVSEVVVPAMILIYVGSCLLIIFTHLGEIPDAVMQIIKGAFGLRPLAGGLAGFAVMKVSVRSGVARGIFSNEAGLGSAPIAAAAARTNEPVRQGLVTMTGTFIDTILVCTMTGLSIIMAGSHEKGLEGVAVTTDAFQQGLPFPERVSAFMLMCCLAIFAFTTILGWNYYSERCLSYLTGSHKRITAVYKWVYIVFVFIGPYMTVEAVWNLADIFNGLMALPNIIALLFLSDTVASETKDYFNRLKAEK
ncbi:alanine/glycine:cation symporter family protein [Ruminococcus sp.]|uniref:alanine/glycine:cation symporter family protein n=1 Tax=Ruminococcus sp. TaxID=41978 RepID=UPI0025E59C06|nr:alanine/glycine:cation symporter family protein [Ruminococcus sp.]MBQ8966453.1 alanine:cation symporter family protein [Ruminococcus sp.]